MTREEALKQWLPIVVMGVREMPEVKEAVKMAITALEQKPCDDCISRQDLREPRFIIAENDYQKGWNDALESVYENAPSIQPQPKMGRCKDCKYFEYDSVAEVHGIPLIIAHEICKRWGDGCQTKEDGYCFLFEPKMQEVEE